MLNQEYQAQEQLFKSWYQQMPEIHQAISWNNLVESAYNNNFHSLTNTAASRPHAQHFLKTAVQKTWYEYLLEKAITSFPALRKFERSSHEEVVLQFRRLDTLNLQYNRALAALKHWQNMPSPDAPGQVTILRTEFNKKARHRPIRKLVEEAGLAIQAVKPVFIMSPLSIANFLPPGTSPAR